MARAVAALAAALALPCLDSATATRLAASEGLVTHLTSLVLVDEATEVTDALPATRKIALPSPRTGVPVIAARAMSMHHGGFAESPIFALRERTQAPKAQAIPMPPGQAHRARAPRRTPSADVYLLRLADLAGRID